MWEAQKKGFKAYLQLEKSLSDHSVEAYLQDIDKFTQCIIIQNCQRLRQRSNFRISSNFSNGWQNWDRTFLSSADYFRHPFIF